VKNAKNPNPTAGVMPTKKQWYTVPEIAQYFNISESLVRKFIRDQKLLHHRVGSKILVRISEFKNSVVRTIEPAPTAKNEGSNLKSDQTPNNEKEHGGLQKKC